MATKKSTIPKPNTRGPRNTADKQELAKGGEQDNEENETARQMLSYDESASGIMSSTPSASTGTINSEMMQMVKMMATMNVQAQTARLEDNRRREIREEERRKEKEERQEEKSREKERRDEMRRKEKEERQEEMRKEMERRDEIMRKEKEERQEEKRKEKEEWRKEKEQRHRDEEDQRQKCALKLFQEKQQSDLERDRKRAAKDVPQLPRLKDGRDIENFLRTFQDQMTMYGVEKAYWSTNLLAVLDDKSLTFQSGLDLADKQDFDVLAAKLVTFHGVTPDFYRTQWNAIKIAVGESHQQCAQRTQTISYNWMKPATTRAEVIDMMNREKLLDVMEPLVRTWVRQQRPKTLNTAAELANTYVMSLPKREEPRKWSRSGGHQEWSKSKPSRVDYSKPSGPSTPAATTPTTTHNDKPPRPPAFDAIQGPRCFQCNEYGHIAKLCPTKLCLMAQVHLRDLERTQGSINGQRVKDLIIDSGCQMTQVHPRWLAPDYRREMPIRIACVHGDVKTQETTTADIEVLGKTVTTQVVVNPNLASDGLIGVDILASGEHKCSYLAQTRSNTKCRRRKKPRSYTTPPNESSDSPDSSAAPQSDTDSAERDSSSMASSNEEESATDSEQSNNTESQPADSELSTSQATDMSDLPNWSDDFFTAARVKSNLTRTQKRQERQLHAAKWGASIPLDGGLLQMKKAQTEDPSLRNIRKKCDTHEGPYIKQNGLIYRIARLPNREAECHQLILPAPYREVILRLAHISPLAAHFGRNKTTDYILRHFMWPGLRRDVAEMCKRCQTCQRTAQRSVRKAKLVPLPVIEVPFTRIAMDMVGPLPRTEEGHRYILTIVDYGSRYPDAIPLRTTSSQDVAEALLEYFSRVGLPQEILTDRGSNFTSDLMDKLYQMLGIRGIRTSAYHPQTDGMVERYNATLKSGLRKYVDKFPQEWNRSIP